jgi:protein tyrosine/serine phosphatase
MELRLFPKTFLYGDRPRGKTENRRRSQRRQNQRRTSPRRSTYCERPGRAQKAGVTSIVNLRQEGLEVEHERKVAESLGLRFLNIPVVGWSLPSDTQVAQFLNLFREPAGPRVFVHCRYGDDRTGVMVATYRIAQLHWTADQAVHEMHFFGFHYYLYPNMASYVREFPAKFASKPAFSLLRTVPASEPETKQP